MKNIVRGAVALLIVALAPSAHAAVRVLATTADWGALTKELGGDRVDVYTATTAMQDVHRVEAKPSLVARARTADLLVANGAELEAGWLPVLLQESGNGRVQRGAPGFFEAASVVTLVEVPTKLDRAMGDIHPLGNPHIHLDPHNVAAVAKALAARLAVIDPAGADVYAARGADFDRRWSAAIARWQEKATPLKDVPVVIMHRDQSYLRRWLGLRELAAIEPKPGVPPSAGYLGELVSQTHGNAAADDPVERLQRPEGGELAVEPRARAGRRPSVLGWRQPGRKGSVRALRRYAGKAAGSRAMNLFSTEVSILWPALIAGALVVISHVPLGQQVFARGIVFIDLAIAQVAGLGVIAASGIGLPVEGWSAQAAAGAAALAGALLLTWTERKRPEAQEALIGILFVLASALQILLLANDPHGGDNLKDLLSGQILWVSNTQLVRTAILTAVFAVVWFLWRERIGRIGFYLLFAVLVTASVQMVGVYLVFTSLIVPAVATYRYPAKRQLAIGYGLGIASYVVGLALSVVTDLPSSAMIVWTMAVLGLFVHLCANGKQAGVREG